MTPPEQRYDRQQRLPGWRQDRLAAATAVVMGVGALGNTVALTLALSGTGRLILCDPDVVEVTNLSRAPLFRPGDVGANKAQAAARTLRELVPELAVEVRPKPLVRGVGLAELRDAAVTLGCLDSRTARLELAGRCGLVRAPWIDGGTGPWEGEVRPYLDPTGPCYGCGLTPAERAVADSPWSCSEVLPEAPEGASSPISALVASWLALMAVRHMMGLETQPETLVIDGARSTTDLVSVKRRSDCPYHEPAGEPAQLAVTAQDTVGRLLDALGPGRQPLAWAPLERRVVCRRCGNAEERWGEPSHAACPRCEAKLQSRTTLELGQAPRDAVLQHLGVAPREILAVREPAGHIAWVELS